MGGREKRRRLARVTQGYDVVCVNNHAMEDMPTTKGERSVPARSLTVPPTLTDASPSGPPLCAEHDNMRMPDRLLRFDTHAQHDCLAGLRHRLCR